MAAMRSRRTGHAEDSPYRHSDWTQKLGRGQTLDPNQEIDPFDIRDAAGTEDAEA